MSAPAYDRFGRSYAATRTEDLRIATAIHAALGNAASVLNVGAGTGSYEPSDRSVTAVEPSAVMRAQRPPGAAPCVDASAEALPFPDGSFDAAMAILTDHHWSDREGGLRELRRVARRVVVFQWNPTWVDRFWLAAQYAVFAPPPPPPPADWWSVLRAGLDEPREVSVPIPHDCRDGFLMAFWRRPEAYLEPVVQANISVFARMAAERRAALTGTLRADLESGAWALRNGWLLEREALDLGYRVLVAE